MQLSGSNLQTLWCFKQYCLMRASIAQWIRLHLPFGNPWFESRYLIYAAICLLNLSMNSEIEQKIEKYCGWRFSRRAFKHSPNSRNHSLWKKCFVALIPGWPGLPQEKPADTRPTRTQRPSACWTWNQFRTFKALTTQKQWGDVLKKFIEKVCRSSR